MDPIFRVAAGVVRILHIGSLLGPGAWQIIRLCVGDFASRRLLRLVRVAVSAHI